MLKTIARFTYTIYYICNNIYNGTKYILNSSHYSCNCIGYFLVFH